jgi:hypothetical protein
MHQYFKYLIEYVELEKKNIQTLKGDLENEKNENDKIILEVRVQDYEHAVKRVETGLLDAAWSVDQEIKQREKGTDEYYKGYVDALKEISRQLKGEE